MRRPERARALEAGFTLVGLVVAMFLVLLVLGIAAPRVAKALRRDRELEAVHRGNQYVRALQLYYRKLGHYPGSLDQLNKTNNVRYLRQRYVDPMTGKADWRLIHVGEAKTTVKGFFGKPLTGLSGTSNIGTSIGSPIGGTTTGTTSGQTSGQSSSGGSSMGGTSGFGSTNSSATASGDPASSGSSSSSFGGGLGSGTAAGTGSSTGSGTQSASAFSGTSAPIMGVSSLAGGTSIITLNEQTTYATWEFLYDPRIEQLKAQSGVASGAASSTGSSSFGSSSFGSGTTGTGSGTTTTTPVTSTPTAPTAPTTTPQ